MGKGSLPVGFPQPMGLLDLPTLPFKRALGVEFRLIEATGNSGRQMGAAQWHRRIAFPCIMAPNLPFCTVTLDLLP
jgi:hypothetical protein